MSAAICRVCSAKEDEKLVWNYFWRCTKDSPVFQNPHLLQKGQYMDRNRIGFRNEGKIWTGCTIFIIRRTCSSNISHKNGLSCMNTPFFFAEKIATPSSNAEPKRRLSANEETEIKTAENISIMIYTRNISLDCYSFIRKILTCVFLFCIVFNFLRTMISNGIV